MEPSENQFSVNIDVLKNYHKKPPICRIGADLTQLGTNSDTPATKTGKGWTELPDRI